MSNRIRVGIAIVAHNAETQIGPCFDALALQTSNQWAAIFVDCASTDDTTPVARLHATRCELRVLAFTPAVGLSIVQRALIGGRIESADRAAGERVAIDMFAMFDPRPDWLVYITPANILDRTFVEDVMAIFDAADKTVTYGRMRGILVERGALRFHAKLQALGRVTARGRVDRA